MKSNELKYRLNDEELNFDICQLMKKPRDIGVVTIIDIVEEN